VEYRGKVVIITGASSGIGYVTAKAFAKRGSTVVAVARREPLLQRLIAECTPHAPKSEYIVGDLGDRASPNGSSIRPSPTTASSTC
jgi:NADP-dependent 3-hydroxy acid dehydrogenase YdfG